MGSEIPFKRVSTKEASVVKIASLRDLAFGEAVMKHFRMISQHPVQQYMS